MHRITLALTAIALLSLTAATPLQAEAGTHPGLRLGINSSTMVGDDVSGAERRPGFTGGLGIVQTLVGPLGISMEVLYTQRGVRRGEWTEFGLSNWVRWIPGSGRQNQTHFGGWKSTSESS